jgi:hypothetical protein
VRRAFASVAMASAIAFGMAGCTFLVTFDDPPSAGLELGTPDARTANDVSVPDTNVAPEDDAGPIEDSAAAVDATVDYSNACVGKPDGKYCNGNKIVVDAGSRDDLVTCLNGMTVSAKLCTNGCARMPSGFPDECDQCAGKTTGLYCGDDFFGWHPDNKNTRIRCDTGAIVGNLICTKGCTGTGPNASCVP